jgi:hypothetical protein
VKYAQHRVIMPPDHRVLNGFEPEIESDEARIFAAHRRQNHGIIESGTR